MHMLVDYPRENHLALAIDHFVVIPVYILDCSAPRTDAHKKPLVNDHTSNEAKSVAENQSVI